jgi:hypothetical protein
LGWLIHLAIVAELLISTLESPFKLYQIGTMPSRERFLTVVTKL